MYPYLHDFFNDVFGTNWQFIVPMFGFWVAMAFLAANYLFTLELKRKEEIGQVHSHEEKVVIGKPASIAEMLSNGLFGFIIGFKVIGAIFNYDELLANPPDFILSLKGSWGAGMAGFAIMAYLKYREKQKAKLSQPKTLIETVHPYQLVGNMTIIAAIAGILGAKLFHNLENISEFTSVWDAIFSSSGLSIYGGLIVGGLAVVFYAKQKGLNVLHVVDACAPGLMAAYGIGRIGCQLAGDGDWGVPNDSPMPGWLDFLPDWMWAYDYPNNVNGVDLKQDFMSMGYESLSGKAWPTPFYETVMALMIFAFLWSIRKKIAIPGRLFSVYLVLNGIERFAIEKIRINPPYHFMGIEATQAELIAILLFLSGIAGWFYFGRRKQQQLNATDESHR